MKTMTQMLSERADAKASFHTMLDKRLTDHGYTPFGHFNVLAGSRVQLVNELLRKEPISLEHEREARKLGLLK